MAWRARTELEAEGDRTFIIGLVQGGGPDITCIQVAAALNARREANARSRALQLGATAVDAEAAAVAARLTVQTVRRDLRIVISRLQEAQAASAAVFLDDQIAACEEDLEATYRLDDQIVADLERSRNVKWVRTRGSAAAAGEKPTPTEVMMHNQQDGPGRADLYGRLQENMRRRAALRAEIRLLRFGRAPIVDGAQAALETQTFAQLITQMGDPEQARQAALQLYGLELRQLLAAEREPTSGELVHLQRQRVASLESRVRSLREYVRLPATVTGDGPRTFEVSFELAGNGGNGAGRPVEEEATTDVPT